MENLLKRIYGIQLESYKKINASLPLYLSEGREFYEVTILGEQFILINSLEMERLNIVTLNKYTKKYDEYFHKNIVYGFPSITSFQRKSLIENKISFIAGNDQIFLPFLGSYFTKCYKDKINKPFDRFSPSSQLLALFMLYNEKNKLNKSEAAKQIGLSAMSVTRAVRDLVQIGILQEERIGNEIFIFREKDKKAMLNEMTPYLINPVQEIIYVKQPKKDMGDFLMSGEYSLSKRTALGYPKYKEYALEKNNIFFDKVTEYNPDLNVDQTLVRVQKWKYNPIVLECNGMVDPISLICSLQEEEDERIQMSLEEVRGEIDTWQIMKN